MTEDAVADYLYTLLHSAPPEKGTAESKEAPVELSTEAPKVVADAQKD